MPVAEVTHIIELEELTQFRALPGAKAVDAENGIIRGVSILSKGSALGHGIEIDEEGLNQCLSACQSSGEEGVKLVMRHDGEFEDTIGALTNFRREGNQVKADAHLLDNHPKRPFVLEVAQKMPSKFGLSLECGSGKHIPHPSGKGKLFRTDDMDCVAFVPKPAANKGLFSAKKVDTQENDNMTDEQITAAVKSAVEASIPAAIAPLQKQVSELQTKFETASTETSTKLSAVEKKETLTKADIETIVTDKVKASNEQVAADAVTKFAATIGVKKAPDGKVTFDNKPEITKFEAKVEELAKGGSRTPFNAAVLRYPDLYNEFRAEQEHTKR